MNREQNNMAFVALILTGFAIAVMVANVHFNVLTAIGNAFIMTLAIWLMYKATRRMEAL